MVPDSELPESESPSANESAGDAPTDPPASNRSQAADSTPTLIHVDETARRVVVEMAPQPYPFTVRLLWLIFVGSWGGLLLIAATAILNFTAVGYIFRPWALQQLPRVMRLAHPSQRIAGPVTPSEREQEVRERPYVRALYFFGLGWWAGGLWLLAAYLVHLPQITEPLAIWMYNRVDAVTTLERRSEQLAQSGSLGH